MIKPVRRWLPGHRLVWGRRWRLCGRLAGTRLCEKSPATVSRLRWDAALFHRPGPPPIGASGGPKPLNGKRQLTPAGLAKPLLYPLEAIEVTGTAASATSCWVFSHTARWYTPGLPPVALRFVLVCDPEGKRRLEAFFCTHLQATPAQILHGSSCAGQWR